MKKALLVGINKYNGCPLNGCVNDVTMVSNYLNTQKFDSVVTLLDEQATTSNILTSMRNLVSGVKSGDTVMFHYSGHGSQVPDRNGDESDGQDECICPIDIDFYAGKYITDDVLHSIFASLPTSVNVEIILDCCHSGTGLRDLSPTIKNRYLPAPTDLASRLPTSNTRELVTLDPRAKENYVLWAACRSSQTAADANLGNTYNGAMTYSLITALKNGGNNYPRATLEKQISSIMKANRWVQNAQLECAVEKQNAPFLSNIVSKEIYKPSMSLWGRVKAVFGV